MSQADQQRKRNHSDLSSISELDTSNSSPQAQLKKKKKKGKGASKKEQGESSEAMTSETEKCFAVVRKELKEINTKLSNVICKDDVYLKEIIKDTFQLMKDEFLKSVSHRIDILEGKLFEKEEENDKLKSKIKDLNKSLEDQKAENNMLRKEVQNVNSVAEEKFNDLEQYGRRDSIRIFGVPESQDAEETAEITTQKAIDSLNKIESLHLQTSDIDLAHRLGKRKPGSHRPIIMKFQSRLKRNVVLQNKKQFKGSQIFVHEDLTRLNQLVLTCVRKKMPDEVNNVWSRNGHTVKLVLSKRSRDNPKSLA